MNYIDIIIAILVILAAVKGFSRGIIKEIISCFALIVGIYIAANFSIFLESYLLDTFPKYEKFISITAFIVVFIIVFLSFKLAGILINKIAISLRLGLVNKSLGTVFGASKAVLLIAIALFEINHLSSSFGNIIPKEQKQKSVLFEPICNIIPTLIPVARQNAYWTKPIEKKVKKIKKGLKE